MVVTISLKDALRDRPDSAYRLSRAVTPYVQGVPHMSAGTFALQDPTWEGRKKRAKDNVIVKAFWTAAEYRSFDRLSSMVCDPDMQVRQRARNWLSDFIKKHGREKCDMMLAEIRRRDELEWFKDKSRTRGA